MQREDVALAHETSREPILDIRWVWVLVCGVLLEEFVQGINLLVGHPAHAHQTGRTIVFPSQQGNDLTIKENIILFKNVNILKECVTIEFRTFLISN